MKKGKILAVLALLLVSAVMASIGSGAIDVFMAKRSSSMVVASDAEGFIGITSTSPYAKVNKNGTISFDFSTAAAKGFNAQSNTEINNVFTVTNQSAETVYVWLEAEGWDSWHNAGLEYRIQETNGEVTNVDDWYGNTQPQGKNLLSSTGMNFVNGVGKMAYVKLEPGEYFKVKILVNTVLSNGYGRDGKDWTHKVIFKANKEAPKRP
ncbi:MAG TPA: hypothetical protein GXX37_01345 [Clostridiaceae bacterium]|nr:hypothetical protein [Clostridiaceae bacterium]